MSRSSVSLVLRAVDVSRSVLTESMQGDERTLSSMVCRWHGSPRTGVVQEDTDALFDEERSCFHPAVTRKCLSRQSCSVMILTATSDKCFSHSLQGLPAVVKRMYLLPENRPCDGQRSRAP